MESLELTHIRSELEEAANTMSLLVEITGSELVLSARSQAALTDLGIRTLRRLDDAVDALQRYEDAVVS
jgi:hypothetical protein